jgi:hypothetical protein
MKALPKSWIIGTVAVLCVSTASGCGDSGGPDVPQTPEEKIKAIEANPDYKPEQKEAYKKQVAENEKLKGMLEQRSREMTPKNPAPR